MALLATIFTMAAICSLESLRPGFRPSTTDAELGSAVLMTNDEDLAIAMWTRAVSTASMVMML